MMKHWGLIADPATESDIMNSSIKFTSITILMVASRFYDVFTTNKYIPDLEGESNILVQVFGFGWTASLLVQFLCLCFLAYAAYIYCYKNV